MLPLGWLKVEHRPVTTCKGVPKTLVRFYEGPTNIATSVLPLRAFWPRLLDDRVGRTAWEFLLSGEVSELPETPKAGPIPTTAG